ncbi:MAG TPA: serine hydrolase [Thermoanaerobaculia bacterium]|nr:serine hydrolase [Thermoanaerobaculia bacterium]
MPRQRPTTRVRATRLAVAVVLLLLAAPLWSADGDPLAGLDAYVEGAMKQWGVPGFGLAVVQDDGVVLARGYGTRTLGRQEPVDEHTVFAIGSQSKAFTTAALALLVDEGELSWDDRVTDHLPGFQLHDPMSTRELTVRDLVTHRSGLERGDMLWYLTDLSRDEIVRRVRHLEPSWSFRSRFGYQNIMFLTAGQLIPAVTRQSWDDFVEARLFEPLGMARSSTTVRALPAQDNVATPHELIDGVVVPVPWKNIDNIAPAGSINSSAAEMAQWVRMQLARGELDGKRLISEQQITEMHRPQMLLGNDPEMRFLIPEGEFASYGLGWFTYTYRGETVVEHGGAIDGMRAQVAMIPARKIGVVMLANLGGSTFTEAMRYRLFDALLGEPEKDWSSELHQTFQGLLAQQAEAETKSREARVADTSPSRPAAGYAGVYVHEMLGELTVTEAGGELRLDYGIAPQARLEHWHFDVFRAADWPRAPSTLFVIFHMDADAKIDEVEVQGLGSFARKPEPPAEPEA